MSVPPGGRVLIVTNDFPPRRGGIESFVASLCEGLEPTRIVVYTASMQGSEAVDAALPYTVVRDPRRMLLPTPAVGRRVRATLRAYGCDQVVFGAAAPLGLLARGLRRAGAERIISITHGHEVWWAALPLSRQLMGRIGDRADQLTYVSEFCRARVSAALSPAARARLTRLRPGVETERFRPGIDSSEQRRAWGVEPGRPLVLSVSRLVARKGHDALVDSWPQVLAACPDAVLVIVGDGPRRAALQRRIRHRGVDQAVRLVRGVPWAQMPVVYAAADVFALPCRTRLCGLEPEAFGIVFIEAAATGLPVVVGRSGGAGETVADGETGFVVDPRDVGEIAGRLIGLLADPDAAQAMGLRGRARVERQFSMGLTHATLRDLLGRTHKDRGRC